jgi:hypothetical protein
MPAEAPAPSCASAPGSLQPGSEFDLVSANLERESATVLGRRVETGRVDVTGEVRNNCNLAQGALVSFTLLDAGDRPVASSASPQRLENLQPGEVRAFRFPNVRAPGAARVVVSIEKG